MHHRITQLQRLFAGQPDCWIAGSYAVDPHQAGDIDLWLINRPITADAIAHSLTPFIMEGIPLTTSDVPQYEGVRDFNRVATWYGRGSTYYFENDAHRDLDVQIMITQHATVNELLAGFDLSCHQQAFSLHDPDHVVRSDEFTGTGKPIIITRFTTPYSTMRRYFKYQERYKLKVDWQSIGRVALAIAHMQPETVEATNV